MSDIANEHSLIEAMRDIQLAWAEYLGLEPHEVTWSVIAPHLLRQERRVRRKNWLRTLGGLR